ncbi:MAG: glycoside hydrolase family 27 protein [Chitinophagaceae bacterium]|nr:glycoside hydrolase family 27 protein [Chitinophagaceae bacterium]
MGWMTWNFFGENINESIIREMADAMVSSGMRDAGYHYIMIDDGWQGGRDNKNNIIPDPKKFPSGIKALADYVHSKGLKLGIYSDAAQLTCAGYTASYGFEDQDAKTFASWGIDYLKYDYCYAPGDSVTAKTRYKKMGDALKKSGRDIVFSICEWGQRYPWFWAANAGGNLWRTTYDVRDSWSSLMYIYEINVELDKYAAPGRWNDPDMLIVGLRGKSGPASDLGGTGCNDIEYMSNMSLWSIMASPLIATNDIRSMSDVYREILTNPEVIAINQDPLGKQAARVISRDSLDVLLKPLSNGDYAVAIMNKGSKTKKVALSFSELKLDGAYEIRDLWQKKNIGQGTQWKGDVLTHETKFYRLKKQS